MKTLLFTTVFLLTFSVLFTSCKQVKKTDDAELESKAMKKTASPEQVVVEYQKWNLENKCTITSTTDRTFHTTLNNVREWLIKLELTGFFSDAYLENKKIYYEDLEFYFNQGGGDDPEFVLQYYIEDSFDNIPYSSNVFKILVKNALINENNAKLETYRFSTYTNVSLYKLKSEHIVLEKDNFEIDKKHKLAKRNHDFIIELINENGKWLIDSAKIIRK